MNLRKKIFWAIVITILFFPLFMYLAWVFTEDKKLNVIIIDKTVNTKLREEHSSFNWILNYNKIVKNNCVLYDINNDYFGYFPDKKNKIQDLDKKSLEKISQIVNKSDVIYFDDSYGVYKTHSNEFSKIIYGGSSEEDAALLSLDKKNKKLVIAEFNVLATPTSSTIKRKLEKTLGVKWTGRVGRCYDNLDTLKNRDLPFWLKSEYCKQHKSWPFKKAGIIFVHEVGEIEILEFGEGLEKENLFINTSLTNATRFDLPEKLKYNFWFDIIENTPENEIISSYQIFATKKGKAILEKNDFPSIFPAIVKGKNSKTYYFSGDFSDNNIGKYSCCFKGITFFSSFLYDNNDKTDRQYFFWKFYKPLISTILNFEK